MMSRSTAEIAENLTRGASTTTRVPAKKRRKVESSDATTTTVDGPAFSDEDVEAALNDLEKDTLDESWYNVLEPEFKKPYFNKLKDFLVTEHKAHTIYPQTQNIYAWSRLTPLDRVKVVVLGQDPYHDAGQAHGLSFSVLPPTKTPPSLRNIYAQMSQDIPGFKIPKSGDLTPLAEQGVLWLNACLTVRAHNANSHSKKGWETFTAEVLRAVINRGEKDGGENQKGVVFLVWGLPAQKTCKAIGIDETKHLVLKSAHPSPLSARKGFLGNEHFKKANEWLMEKYGEGIDWTVLNP